MALICNSNQPNYPQRNRRDFMTSFGGSAMALLGMGLQSSASAEEPDTQLVSFSREEKRDAQRQIPLDQLAPGVKSRVSEIIHDPSIFRRLPVQVVNCDPELYSFLISYPEIVVSIWKLMGISNVVVRRLSPSAFHANDGAGTVSTVNVLLADNSTKLFLAEGYYEGSLAPGRILANCVLLLKSGFTKSKSGETFVSNRLDVFVRFENKGADFLARTLHPLIGKTADYNFAESTAFLGKISHNAENNLAGMQRLVNKLSHVDPTVRNQFSDVVNRVYQRRVHSDQELREKLSEANSFEKDVPLAIHSEPRKFVAPTTPARRVSTARPLTDLAPVPRKREAKLRR